MQPGIIHNTHEQIMATCSLPSTVEDELLKNLYIANNCSMPNGGTPITRTSLHTGSSFPEGYSGNTDMGTSLSAASLTNIYVGSGESLFSISNSSNTSALPLNMRSFDSCDSFNSSYPMSRDHDYGIQDGPGCNEFLKVISTVHPSYHVIGSPLPGWNSNNSTLKLDHSDNYSLPRNELSLSLGSCQPSVIYVPDIPDHCSEKSCSVVTQVTAKDSEELSLYCGPSSSAHFSHVLLGSRYLNVAQQVLAEIVSYALGNSEELDDSVSGIEGEARMSFSSSCSRPIGLLDVGPDEFTPSGEIKSHGDIEHLLLEETKPEKTKLVAMLQMVRRLYRIYIFLILKVV